MRLIDADKLLKEAWFCDLDHWSGKVVDEDIINEAPTVCSGVLKHGHWYKPTGMMPTGLHGMYVCSECGSFANYYKIGRIHLSNFCPECGAKMDGELDETY